MGTAVTTGSHGPRRSSGRRAAPRRSVGGSRTGSRGGSRATTRTGSRAAPRRVRPAGQNRAAEQTAALTAVGALLTVLGCTLTGSLLDGMFGEGHGLATWFGFVAGCVTATIKIRSRDLLILVVSAPLVFVVAVVVGQTVRLWGSENWLRTELIGLATTLSEGAPWLFVGTAAVLAIAWARGLRDHLRTLRAELRGEKPQAPTATDEPSSDPDDR